MLANNKLMTIVLLVLISTFAVADQLSIQSVERQVILNGPYPLEQVLVSFRSQGNVNVFKHAVPAQIDERTSKIIFSKSKQGRDPLPYTREQYLFNGQKYALYKVQLDRSYYSDEEGQLYILTVYLNRYINFPQEITMSEDQKFEFFDNKHFISPYKVESQFTTYKFDKVIDYDKTDKNAEAKGINTVVFRKKSTEPFAIEEHRLHGVNNDPQVYFTDVDRIIEVSHWGNIAITQFYALKNYGPNLKGQFSRVNFGTLEQNGVKNAFKGIQETLPYDVWGLYYRDEVGNISTSKAYRDQYQNKVRFALVPRFALLGGWKCNWELGYNLPTKNFLYHENNKFQLDNIGLQYTLEKIVAENYSFKIILPEGASQVKVRIGDKELVPTKVENSFGYLDFFGRPTFVFQNYRQNLKNKKLTVDYELDTLSTLYKPIVLFVIIFSLLAILIIAKRLRLQAFKEQKTD